MSENNNKSLDKAKAWMEENRIDDFVDPVSAPKGQASHNHIPVALLDFVGIDVEDDSQQGDNVPLELAAIPENRQGLLGKIGGHERLLS